MALSESQRTGMAMAFSFAAGFVFFKMAGSGGGGGGGGGEYASYPEPGNQSQHIIALLIFLTSLILFRNCYGGKEFTMRFGTRNPHACFTEVCVRYWSRIAGASRGRGCISFIFI